MMQPTHPSIAMLPLETLNNILSDLHPVDIISLSRTCKQLHNTVAISRSECVRSESPAYISKIALLHFLITIPDISTSERVVVVWVPVRGSHTCLRFPATYLPNSNSHRIVLSGGQPNLSTRQSSGFVFRKSPACIAWLRYCSWMKLADLQDDIGRAPGLMQEFSRQIIRT